MLVWEAEFPKKPSDLPGKICLEAERFHMELDRGSEVLRNRSLQHRKEREERRKEEDKLD